MFAVRNKNNGKFLKAFSGSFNKAKWNTRYNLAIERFGAYPGNGISEQEAMLKMFCLKTPNGGQIYKTVGAVKTSIGDKDWIEIVPIKIIVNSKNKV